VPFESDSPISTYAQEKGMGKKEDLAIFFIIIIIFILLFIRMNHCCRYVFLVRDGEHALAAQGKVAEPVPAAVGREVEAGHRILGHADAVEGELAQMRQGVLAVDGGHHGAILGPDEALSTVGVRIVASHRGNKVASH
jgi:hypothetical protein